MNQRERILETLLFGNPDKVPLMPGMGRESTRAKWYTQGLPRDVKDIPEYAFRMSGGKDEWPSSPESFPVDQRMIPQFEEKVIEKKEASQIVQDWKGNICEISNDYSLKYLRDAIDFVTRRWIKCPVENRDDWEDMKKRYNPDDPSRFSDDNDPAALGKRLQNREWFFELHFSGPFWQLREWVGFENLCMMFYDDPELVRDMIDFWTDFVARLLQKTLSFIAPDSVHLSEDMAYKEHSMISPDMVREYLLPAYRCWGEIVHNAGCPVYAVDSDGHIGELIPIWMEAGANACDPIEVAAGNDIVEFRNTFGKKMAFRGGVDKRAMAKGGSTIEDEIRRIEPVVKSGGYIPGCDHGVPSDVSWPDYVRYVGLLAGITGWH